MLTHLTYNKIGVASLLILCLSDYNFIEPNI
nr:MAG TPA: hypothetical protein [Caudoviricetes sp.]DAS03922.1 MAG TPA: hypothetical protein [Bacteriophage sp.]DAV43341.1 MAG TPA: hypothetical protein [Caudoviricetes sp.]DAW42775.1 MAG TPA: hypothetical protein [Caudoviricetes sp.]